MSLSALTIAGLPSGQQRVEQAHLGGEIGVERAVVVEVVARQVGEGGRREAHAVEAALLDAVRGRLHREMRDTVGGEPVEALVQGDRVGGRQRAVDAAIRRDDADRAERGGGMAEGQPDLPAEGGDRGLAAGAGDRNDRLGLAGMESGGGPRQRVAGVVDEDARDAGRQRRLRLMVGDDRHGALLDGLGNEAGAVGLGAGKREEGVARRDLAAVGRKAGDLDAAEPGGAGRFGQQGRETRQWRPSAVWAGVLAKPYPIRARRGKGSCGRFSIGGRPSRGATRSMILPVTSPEFQAAVW